jgi:Gluconate 2-dehydrogenase subunit 3
MMEEPKVKTQQGQPPREVHSLSRRQIMQGLLGGAGVGFVLPGAALTHPVHQHPFSANTSTAARTRGAAESAAGQAAGETDADAGWKPAFFDPHQDETLTVLAELIVPNSTRARVNRFIDTLISVDSEENQKNLIASLSAFDHEAIIRYNGPLKDLTEEQQIAIVTAASTGKPSRPGPAGRRRRRRGVSSPRGGAAPPLTLRDHFEDVKGWVSGAFYSSEIGMKELGWTGQVAWDRYPGCEHTEGHS